MTTLQRVLETMPLLAILRGIVPTEAEVIGEALVGQGVLALEVPLNSEDPFDSIHRLSRRFGDRALIGAGTVRTPEEVRAVKAARGRLIVLPHGDPRVIEAAKHEGLAVIPGFTTVAEAFAAIEAGADALKLFPAEAVAPEVLRAMMVVLPPTPPVLPVGSIRTESLAPFWQAGARGFGLGSSLYQPGWTPEEVATAAAGFVRTLQALRAEYP